MIYIAHRGLVARRGRHILSICANIRVERGSSMCPVYAKSSAGVKNMLQG